MGIVVGEREDEIASAIGTGSRFGLKITYIGQEQPLGLAHCVTVARPFLGDDDFVMYLGDNVLPEGVAGIADDFRALRPDAQVAVCEVADPRAFGVAEVNADGTVRRLAEKPAEPLSRLALMGVYFFTPAVYEAIAAIAPSARGELEITDALQWLVTHGAKVRASEYRGYWRDAGAPETVLDCNHRLLAGLRSTTAGEVDAASVISGTVVVETGARVRRSTIHGPVIIGAGSLVQDSLVGPGTSIGRDCVLHATELRNSILFDEVRLSGASGVEDSIIGRGSVVALGTDSGHRRRLLVGDQTRIELAS
ncbi:glucose-1-phosphate thymidylyltransferase [Nocardiopsis ansamitocini]|uniref:Glucose-1-phosphate thymidylyltransferase n=1 Tax=Nocardiopsis ansamitocini TaxID=1670832 RepID=A0A9W6P7Y9_9ACTN|nr:glucose-1-phosphate thymidylyltransferase [Nocardiopsis ansamitocini]